MDYDKDKAKPPHKLIFEYLLAPLLRCLDHNVDRLTTEAKLDLIFDTQHRTVFYAKTIARFKMPGKTWSTKRSQQIINPTTQERSIPIGTPLVIRVDTASKDKFCEVEIDSLVFVLTQIQWAVVRPKIERVG